MKKEDSVIIIMKHGASEEELAEVQEKLSEHGYTPLVTRGVEDTIVAALGIPVAI